MSRERKGGGVGWRKGEAYDIIRDMLIFRVFCKGGGGAKF